MNKKYISHIKSSILISGIAVCFGFIITGCSQSNRYGMQSSSSSEEDSDTEKVEMNLLPVSNALFWNSLHRAAEEGDIERVNQLCSDSRVDVNAKNDFYETPLHIAAENGHIEVVKKLLTHKDIEFNTQNIFNETPLDLALENDHEEVIDLLLKHGAVSGRKTEALSI